MYAATIKKAHKMAVKNQKQATTFWESL